MKYLVKFIFILTISTQLNAQCYEGVLQSNLINDGLNTDPANWVGNVYNDIWGVHINDREFAVMGSYEGTHFIDVTDPQNPVEVQFVAAAVITEDIVHRDFHDYNGYLYTVADEGDPNSTLQIIDITDLPNSVNVVYDSNDLFSITHNIFIDSLHARLYTCDGQPKVISLDDPTNPQELYTFNGGYVHDMYVRDHIGYLNMGGLGLQIVDFSSNSGYTVLGSITSYPDQGYNHSGWLSEDGKHYVLADETHGTRLKVLNVEDPSDITVVALIDDGLVTSNSIPHNLIIKDDLVYASYYYDGVQVFSIADPMNPVKVAEYDTYQGSNDNFFRGAWGVYPNLESGNILISDMQTGLYIIQVAEVDPMVEFVLSESDASYNFSVVNSNIDIDYWLWDFGNGVTSSEENPSVTYDTPGVYTVCLTIGNSLCLTTECEDVSAIEVGLEEFNDDALQIYFDGSDLSLKSKTSLTDLNLNLIDMNGKLVYSSAKSLLSSGEVFHLDIPNALSSGLYLLNAESVEGFFSYKLLQP